MVLSLLRAPFPIVGPGDQSATGSYQEYRVSRRVISIVIKSSSQIEEGEESG